LEILFLETLSVVSKLSLLSGSRNSGAGSTDASASFLHVPL